MAVRTETLYVRVTPEDKARAEKLAEKHGISLSKIVSLALMRLELGK
jgi:predicted HicB family RNase H-like nuclease